MAEGIEHWSWSLDSGGPEFKFDLTSYMALGKLFNPDYLQKPDKQPQPTDFKIQIPFLTFIICVTLDKSFKLHGPQFPNL